MTEGRVVTFCADDNYMEHAHVLVESLHRSNPGLHIYGRLVNTEQTVPCEVLHDNTELSTKRDLFKLAGRFDHTFFETEFSFLLGRTRGPAVCGCAIANRTRPFGN